MLRIFSVFHVDQGIQSGYSKQIHMKKESTTLLVQKAKISDHPIFKIDSYVKRKHYTFGTKSKNF